MSGELFRQSLVPYTTTANALAGYHDELLACGFSANEVRALVRIAARNTMHLQINPAFVDRAAAPAPIGLRIENHESGPTEDLAIRKRFRLDEGDRD